MNRSVASALSAVAVSVFSAHAGAAVTAEFLPLPEQYGVGASVGFDAGGTNTKFGQTFLALTSGALESVVIGNLYHNSVANAAQQALHLDLYDVTDTGGLPAGAPLGGYDTPAASIPTDVFPLSPTLSYSGPTISIIAGRRYAFVVGTEFGVSVDFNAPYSMAGTFLDYADGSAIRADIGPFNEGFDFGFQVNVVIPAPGSLAMVGAFALAGLGRRRR